MQPAFFLVQPPTPPPTAKLRMRKGHSLKQAKNCPTMAFFFLPPEWNMTFYLEIRIQVNCILLTHELRKCKDEAPCKTLAMLLLKCALLFAILAASWQIFSSSMACAFLSLCQIAIDYANLMLFSLEQKTLKLV